jgi:hypothetical protein
MKCVVNGQAILRMEIQVIIIEEQCRWNVERCHVAVKL